MARIPILSIDPAFRNVGFARMVLDLDTMSLEITHLDLIQTEKRANKVVRQNSDDLRRAKELYEANQKFCQGMTLGFAEIPYGAQSARAAYGFGAAVMLVASCPMPVIQVQNFEAKLATVGTKTAAKDEMIEWAVETYPNAPWLRHRGKLKADNEHLADAVAIAHAGIRTAEFRQLAALWIGAGKNLKAA